MCGFMPPPDLPKRRAGLNSFIAGIAVTWVCFKLGCARSSMRCAKDYAFRSVSFCPWLRLQQRHRCRTDFLYGSKEEILNRHVFNEAKSRLLKSIADNPDRFVGGFRSTTPRLK